jgi:hypothetical protein
MLLGKTSDGPRFPRGQKFTLSAAGKAAEEAYRAVVMAARSTGRSALDAAVAAWSSPLRVAPGDGVLLGELRGKPRGLSELSEGLDAAGIAPGEVRAAVGRLVAAGLLEPVPPPSQQPSAAPPPPTGSRW